MVSEQLVISRKIKENINMLIQNGDLKEAKILLNEYKSINNSDIEIYSIEAVINIMQGKISEAETTINEGLKIDGNNFDLNYNLAYIYQIKNEKELEFEFYKKSLVNCSCSDTKKMIIDKISDLKKHIEIKINKKIINKFENLIKEMHNYNVKYIIKSIQILIKNRKFKEILDILYCYLQYSELCIPEIYYFAAYSCCGLKRFEECKKYHYIAIKLNSELSNIVDKKNIAVDYKFDDESINCIGCNCNHFEIVNVSNQSVSESNKGIINPIRTWVKCKKCGLVYGNPLPSEESLNKYYSIIAKEKFGGIYGNIKDRESFLFQMSNTRLNNINNLTNKKKLLDIGTGIGFFVKCALDKGYDAYGLELTTEDCEYAKAHYGLELMQRNFYSFSDDEKYDIVTMFEVIEHMRSPLKDLKRINKLVKMNGIFVIATPILDSEYGEKTKEENVFWNVVTHLSYFTKDVLIKYLESAGFKVMGIVNSMEGMGRMEFYCKKIKG